MQAELICIFLGPIDSAADRFEEAVVECQGRLTVDEEIIGKLSYPYGHFTKIIKCNINRNKQCPTCR